MKDPITILFAIERTKELLGQAKALMDGGSYAEAAAKYDEAGKLAAANDAPPTVLIPIALSFMAAEDAANEQAALAA